jgi:asparagine synthase (glutamine-hydrolysing)
MSGFAGIIWSADASPDARLFERIAAALNFRGPDATQIWSRPGAGLCFTLLRTGPTPQGETQPVSLDGRTWLIGEVRVDARNELIRKLEQHGEKVDANATSEELVLRAWRLWAEKSFEVLIGDFAFAIWDQPANELWCARDLLGTRPFFYAHGSGQLVFSNTLEAVRLVPSVTAELDLHFIGDFLLDSWSHDPERTAFRDIRRLPAGHLLRYASGEIQVRRFARLPIEEPLHLKRREEYVEQFRHLFEEAVRDRLPCGPAGVFMSGGLDSTSVAAVANKVQTTRAIRNSLRAFTVDYKPLFDDPEGEFASRAAKHMGIPMDMLSGGTSFPFEDPAQLSPSLPEPTAEPFLALQVAHHCQLAAHARVALSGHGGDIVLTGRAWPHLLCLLERGRLDKLAIVFGGYFLRHGRLPPLRAGIRARLRRWIGRADSVPEYPRWLALGFEKDLHLRDRWRELQNPQPRDDPRHPLHPAAYASLSGPFWPSVLETDDAACTGVPTETRAPFLDIRLLRFLLRVPPVPWCMHKALLREVMTGLLPEEIRLRRKTPLQADPLQLHAQKNSWKPRLDDGACERLHMFVNCNVLHETSFPSPGSSLWADLRLVALDRWLKRIENAKGFQYSRIGGTE